MFGMQSLMDSGSGGGDVNAGAIGGVESGDTSGMGSGSPAFSQTGTMAQDSSGANPNVDPAMQSVNVASQGADQLEQQASSNAQQAGNPAAAAGGLAGGIASLFDSKAKKVAQMHRKVGRAQAQAAVDNSQRAIDQFAADSSRQRQQLQQSYAGRGIGESSIQQSGMQYFNDTAARKAAELDQNFHLAVLGQQLTSSEIALSYRQPYMNIVGGILSMV